MTSCGDLVPRHWGSGVPVDDGDCGECLLREGHTGMHLVKTSMGYYVWTPDDNFCVIDCRVCDCDYIECYVYRNITDADAQELLRKHG